MSKFYGFSALTLAHFLVCLTLYLLGFPYYYNYLFVAAIIVLITQPFLRKAIFFYWNKIPISQLIAVIVLSLLLTLNRGLVGGVLIFPLAFNLFFAFFARNWEKTSDA